MAIRVKDVDLERRQMPAGCKGESSGTPPRRSERTGARRRTRSSTPPRSARAAGPRTSSGDRPRST
jgi:hypothetical protein